MYLILSSASTWGLLIDVNGYDLLFLGLIVLVGFYFIYKFISKKRRRS
ncbi:hypothetical protein [Metabacillus fastidiosus]|nr:hypothetical protein [Metabacillus fastidiosus]MED4462059.1 hypothetical protein [Metabacillus fastidiosus]